MGTIFITVLSIIGGVFFLFGDAYLVLTNDKTGEEWDIRMNGIIWVILDHINVWSYTKDGKQCDPPIKFFSITKTKENEKSN